MKKSITILALLALSLVFSRTYGLINSGNDVDTPAANAVVDLGGCTGTLISPRVVLTALHCIAPQIPPQPPWGTAPAQSAGRGPVAYSQGSLYLVGGNPSRLYARTVEAPLFKDSDVSTGQPFVAMAAVPGRILAITADRELFSYSLLLPSVPGASGWQRLGRIEHDFVGMAASGSHLYALKRGRELLRAPLADPLSWTTVWTPPSYPRIGITGMTAAMGTVYATTDMNRLLILDPAERLFTDIGHANGVVALAAVDNRLIAQDSKGVIWWRHPVPWEENWEAMGIQEELFTTMSIAGNELFGVLRDGRSVRTRVSLKFADIGPGPAAAVLSMTANESRLFALTVTGRVLSRAPLWDDRQVWTDIGGGGGVQTIAAVGSELYGYRADGTLWRRTVTNTSWTSIPDTAGSPGNIAMADIVDKQLYLVTMPPAGWALWRRNSLGANAGYTRLLTHGPLTELAAGPGWLYAFSNSGSGRLWRSNLRAGMGNAWTTVEDYLVPPGVWTTYASLGTTPPTVGFGATRPFDNDPDNRLIGNDDTIQPDAFMSAGHSDIALARLPTAVDPSRAIPIPVAWSSTTLPAASGPPFPQFTLVGWGCLGNGNAATTRQRAQTNGGYDWPMVMPGLSSKHQVTVHAGALGGATTQGDSGGPLLFGSPPSVIGVMNIGATCTPTGASGTDSTYAITFLQPYTDSSGAVRPASAIWIQKVLGNMREPRITVGDRFMDRSWPE